MPAAAVPAGLTLRTRDREPLFGFYRDLLGLAASVSEGAVSLSPADGGFTLTLEIDPQAPARPARALGLYHFALLLPTRAAVAGVVRRLMEGGYEIDGASDHIVSEAVYLRDPEGNGIELARDRPKNAWRYANGELAMITDMLDLDGLLAETRTAFALHPRTRLGHVHLSVDDLSKGEAFYAGGLGLTVTQRTYPGALFLAAGGYHHHVGMNIWGARRPAPPGAAGLVGYSWRLPKGSTAALRRHLNGAHIPYEPRPFGIAVTDPIGLSVELGDA